MAPNLALLMALRLATKKQKTIATRTCIAPSTLSKIIHGHRQATAREREKLATVLGRTEAELFPPPEEMPA